MRKLSLPSAALLLFAVVCTGPAFGAGFSIFEQGMKASAQAGAFAARADDPSAIFYNPAGITQLDGTQVYVGLNGITLDGKFQQFPHKGTFHQQSSILTPGAAYVTHSWDRVSAGIGLMTPFGLTTEWGRDFSGRYIARKSELVTAFVNPTVAFKVNDNFSFAVGASYIYADVELTRNLNFSSFGAKDGFLRLTGDTTAWAGNIGLRFESDEGYVFGLTYRDEATLKFDDAEAEFQDTPVLADVLFCGGFSCFPDQKAKAELKLPRIASLGVGTVKEKWDVEFDIVWHDWSSFKTLAIDFEDNTTLLPDSVQNESWVSTLSYRLGVGYRINDNYEFRFGGYWDENPIPDETLRPLLPDADRTSAQIGFGYKADNGWFAFDTYYQALFFRPNITTSEESGFNGRYSTFANLFGIAGHWKF